MKWKTNEARFSQYHVNYLFVFDYLNHVRCNYIDAVFIKVMRR